ncbi:MAG TPA: heme o synthase [Pirellulales bacterium]|jgi:protoheme IX farnesyltransferase|nr:heme o synthase [Pirellulales bacterium]
MSTFAWRGAVEVAEIAVESPAVTGRERVVIDAVVEGAAATSTVGMAPRVAHGKARQIARDYLELTKPRISALVLVTVAVSAFMAHWGPPDPLLLLNTLVGTALVAASASALNQHLERKSDSVMERTADRPLPSGRLSDAQVLWFGGLTIASGLLYLAIAVNCLTAVLGAATWILYVVVYTPLKSRTPLNTVVGAVAGALPTLMGWTAVGGSLSFSLGGGGVKAATLFLIVYLWQFPHFMAIAWMYRHEYAEAGLKMLTVVDPSGWRAGMQAVASALALVPVSLAPILQHAGPVYFCAASVLGLIYLAAAAAFCYRRDERSARSLLRVSLVYLPALLALFMFVPLV